jgi:four helix bundle protein
MKFDHEKLEVYKAALSFIRLSSLLTDSFPPGKAYLTDQLHRAALSICLNTAEGAGEYSRKDKARFYRMARRSATECASILDVCRTFEIGTEELLGEGRTILLKIVSMKVKLIKALDGPRLGHGHGQGQPLR